MNQRLDMNSVERIEQNLGADSKFKGISELLKASSNQPSLSGFQDIDYPNMLHLAHRIPLISHVNSIPLPQEVIEQFVNMQQNCTLGIFPEISRAYLSVDNSIFFWAYDNASDVAYYDGLNQTIIAVQLIKPRANVFKSHIKYLLCLATASEITLFGVTYSEGEQDTLPTVFLIPDPLFTLSTDQVNFSVLTSSDNGRIFLGGNDGCLYEIVYQADDGWFSKKCRKINHSQGLLTYVTPSFLNFHEQEPIVQIEIDNSRHLLYTRTEKSTIQIYDLGHDGTSMRYVTSKSLSAIVNQASCIARTIETTNFKPIVGIQKLTKSESDTINLVAVTQTGVRLYFSTNGYDRPSSLDLVHVRLPPGFTPSSIMQRPNSISNIYHKNNTFIMTSTQTENKDLLWVMSNDFYVYEDQMMEAFSVSSLGARVWCIAEETKPSMNLSNTDSQVPPLVVRQHAEERRKFILLTSEGIHIFYKHRPIDQLSMILTDNQGPENPAVRFFFQSTKLTEACLTSLILASSSHLPQEKQLVEWATLAFFRYGGEPKAIRSMNPNGSYMPTVSTPMSSPVHNSTQLMSMSPILSQYSSNNQLGTDQIDVQFSAKHDAVYLYLARILRSIWQTRVANAEPVDQCQNLKVLVNSVPIDEISLNLKRLSELKHFLDTNLQIMCDSSKPNNKLNIKNDLSEATELEKESLNSSVRLLVRSIEVLNLYKLLYEHQFSSVCTNLPAECQSKLSMTTFKELIIMGSELTTSIASALVRRYLDDNISTDAISRRLHELCPSIFRQENALQAKAHEMVLQSRSIVDKVDKERMMNEAVSLLKKIGVRLDLQAICDLLHSARAYKYIVDICLFVAEKRDPLNLACVSQTRLMNNSAIDDGEARTRATALNYRMDCYMKIIETLERILNTENFDEVFDCCIKSTDELFHSKLYEWLCEKNLSSKLLNINSAYIENFLKKKTESDNYSTKYLDLMWRFYERKGNFYWAAKVLDRLACRRSTDYGLDERLEYLSRAKGCIEALSMQPSGEYLHELEEKMDVVKIQIQVQKRLKELPESGPVTEAISQLNYTLSDLDTLYKMYAQKFRLYDCQLAILKCGNIHEPILIEKLWKEIIDEVLKENLMESPDTQLYILSNRIENLGKTLMPSERFFPVYFIIAYLEFTTHSYGNNRWVLHCLLKIGFKPIQLLDPYHKFYKSREHSIYWAEKSIHVLRVIANLIEDSLNKPDRSFATACLDVICDYLIDLQTMVNTDKDAKKLQETFTILQSRIKQLLGAQGSSHGGSSRHIFSD